MWFLPSENRWRDLNLLAYRDVGQLTVGDSSIEFKSGSRTVVINQIRNVSYGKQGRDFVNNWVRVEYEEDGTLTTAFFADGSMRGWGGIFGGTKRILQAVKRVPKVAVSG